MIEKIDVFIGFTAVCILCGAFLTALAIGKITAQPASLESFPRVGLRAPPPFVCGGLAFEIVAGVLGVTVHLVAFLGALYLLVATGALAKVKRKSTVGARQLPTPPVLGCVLSPSGKIGLMVSPRALKCVRAHWRGAVVCGSACSNMQVYL
jgi:hypothetical protein